jgi:hypothetical protein
LVSQLLLKVIVDSLEQNNYIGRNYKFVVTLVLLFNFSC